jgi:hypothetical protein
MYTDLLYRLDGGAISPPTRGDSFPNVSYGKYIINDDNIGPKGNDRGIPKIRARIIPIWLLIILLTGIAIILIYILIFQR